MRPCPPVTALLSFALPLLAASLLLTGCQENNEAIDEDDRFFKKDPEHVPMAHRNRLESEPTAFLRSHAVDPIHWQPWSAQLFDHALSEQKTILALVVNGNFPVTQVLLEDLASDPELIRILHGNYICTLVDMHSHPEMALVSSLLASEIRRPISFPTVIWFSHERHPIAWLPLSRGDVMNFNEILSHSHDMLNDRWEDNPRYVVRNSHNDNAARVNRIRDSYTKVRTVKLRESLSKAARQLSALYDPTSGEMDGSGGLVPFGLLQFASAVATDPATSPTLRKRLVTMVEGHTNLLLESAVRDPLDGGFFSARRTRGWSLPVLTKDSVTQLEGILALTQIAALSGQQRYLQDARDILAFTEARFTDGQGGLGLFEYPASAEKATEAYLLSREKLSELLQPEEFSVAETCYGIKPLGNIPIEADPKRSYFRLNSLRAAVAPADAAAELGITPVEATALLESARQRLLVHRRELLGHDKRDIEWTRPTHLDARYAAVLTELGAATSNDELLDRARSLLESIRKRSVSENGLMRLPAVEGRRGIAARGLDYATLLDALFRLYRHDLDSDLLVWAHELAVEALEKLADEQGLLQEVPADDRLLLTPNFSSTMIFGSSTWGTIYGPLTRLHLLTGSEKFAAILKGIDSRLVNPMTNRALLHTDFGVSALAALSGTLVCLDGPDGAAALADLHAVVSEPAHAGVTVARLDASLPGAFSLPKPTEKVRALVMRGGELVGQAANADDLRALLAALANAQ